jgi:tetratricopeptide (TPR) repeat protein
MPEDPPAISWDFFVSYTQQDREWAEWIAWKIEAAGWRVLIQAWDMPAGSNWVHLMSTGTAKARRTIAVLSPAYLASAYGEAEWQAAWNQDPLARERKLLVLRVADCERPGLLASVVTVDLFGTSEPNAESRLLNAVKGLENDREKPPQAPAFPEQIRTNQLRPRFPATRQPDIWHVPSRYANFTGRIDELARIGTNLSKLPSHPVALHGMGGIGKTQTAIEYAYRNGHQYSLVWWMDAEAANLLSGQFSSLAARMQLHGGYNADAAVKAVLTELGLRDQWLLIFDNAEDPDALEPLLPRADSGHVLITTRRGGFRRLGTVIDLDLPDLAASTTLLRKRAGVLTESDASLLAERLDRLPLALDQAASFIDAASLPARDYLSLLDTHQRALYGRQLPARSGDSEFRSSHTINTVWSVSLDKLRTDEPAAVQLLNLCAWLAPEPIPIDLFSKHASHLSPPLSGLVSDPLSMAEVVAVLVDYSLARRTDEELLLHRLVQDVTRHRQPDAADLLASVLTLLWADLPDWLYGNPKSWPRWRQLLPHVLTATGHADRINSTPSADTAMLLRAAGSFLHVIGRLTDALPLLERALEIDEQIYGRDDPNVAMDLHILGALVIDLQPDPRWVPVLERAIRIHESAYGVEALAVAKDLNVLAQLLDRLDRLPEALSAYERAIKIEKHLLSENDPTLAVPLSNMGATLQRLGRPHDARTVLERALRIYQDAGYGSDHPPLAWTLLALGRVMRDLD